MGELTGKGLSVERGMMRVKVQYVRVVDDEGQGAICEGEG